MRLRHIAGAAFLAGQILSLQAQANTCENVFAVGEKPEVLIEDLFKAKGTGSKIKDNFKVQLMSLFQTIENQYGPLSLKAQTAGIDWAKSKTEALRAAGQVKTAQEQYKIVVDLLTKFNDGHVSIQIPSNLVYRLPIQLSASQGRYFVSHLAEFYPRDQVRPGIGDEIISINGLGPEAFRKQFGSWDSSGNTLTSQAIFGLSFGTWREARGLPLNLLPSDGVVLGIRSAETGAETSLPLKFNKSGSGFVNKDLDGKGGFSPNNPTTFEVKRIQRISARDEMRLAAPNTTLLLDHFHKLFRAQKTLAPGEKMGLGNTDPFFQLPADFKRIELPAESALKRALRTQTGTDELFAGTFVRRGQKVGFLRIPSYSPESMDMNILNLRFIISKLKAETDYLIVDQTNNPGGYVIYSDLVVKSFTGRLDPNTHLRFSVKPSQSFLRQYLEMHDRVILNQDGLLTKDEAAQFGQRFLKEYKKIQRAFEEGRDLSEPISMLVMTDYYEAVHRATLKRGMPMGGELQNAAQLQSSLGVDVSVNQTYDKKIFFMINELDFSGGDATPASLRDYGRVKLVGTRTAGAGGTVEEFRFRGLSEATIQLTTSLMVRKEGRLVENYGVRPDIEVPSVPTDIRDGYANYFERMLLAIESHR